MEMEGYLILDTPIVKDKFCHVVRVRCYYCSCVPQTWNVIIGACVTFVVVDSGARVRRWVDMHMQLMMSR